MLLIIKAPISQVPALCQALRLGLPVCSPISLQRNQRSFIFSLQTKQLRSVSAESKGCQYRHSCIFSNMQDLLTMDGGPVPSLWEPISSVKWGWVGLARVLQTPPVKKHQLLGPITSPLHRGVWEAVCKIMSLTICILWESSKHNCSRSFCLWGLWS